MDVVGDYVEQGAVNKRPGYRPLTGLERNCLMTGGTVEGWTAKEWGVGMRFNKGKPPVYKGFIRYFPRAIELVSQVSEFGAEKYAWDNWQQLPDGSTNCAESMCRHIINEAKGRVTDVDSELLEAAHAAWNAMARLEFIAKEREEQTNA